MLLLWLFRMLRTPPVRVISFIIIGASLLLFPVIPSQAQSSCNTLTECLKSLKSDNEAKKSGAIFTLGRLGDKRAVPALIQVFHTVGAEN